MRKISTLLAVAAGFALAAGAAAPGQAQTVKSWGTKTTTYWSAPETGYIEPGKTFDITAMPTASPGGAMYYQPPARRVKAMRSMHRAKMRPMMRQGMRPRQAQPGEQPPAASPGGPPNAQPGGPPTDQGQGTPPARGQQPGQGTVPK